MSEQFTRGRKSQLSALTAATDLQIGIQLTAPGATWDISCFCLDPGGNLADDRYLVFYNQPQSPDGSVRKLGAQGGDAEVFQVRLGQVEGTIGRLSFCAALDGPGTASQIQSGYLRIVVDGSEVMRYAFTGADFGTERAIMIADLYRKGVWRVGAVGQGFAGGLADLIRSFGGTVDDEPAPAPPAPTPPPTYAAPPGPPMQPGPPMPPPPVQPPVQP
ncbi:MAG: hypothetical protein HKP61_17370, partial [Dactylosporangium sp.]|nr:TerD family protein [Dactylosporangium sp.]NNJ62677.1 hypothetical protein [Dactylosporangium sp.]